MFNILQLCVDRCVGVTILLQVSRIYDVPVDMIKCVFKKTKKG